MNKIEDFGQKIGGARKDTWSSRGLLLEDTIDMNEMEKLQYVTKENIWPLPDAKKQVHEGMDNYVAFFIRKMRRIANTKPMARHNTDTDIVIKDYINAMVSFRKRVEQIKTVNDMADFFTECKAKSETGAYWNITEWKAAVDGWKIQEFYINLRYYKRKCESTNFPYGKKSVSKKPKKKSYIPPQLEHVVRNGEDFLKGWNATPEKWQNTFAFRGVEFGNWNSQNDRQQNLNMCYLALKDLAVILDISDKDIAFNGRLALGFGSRGRKAAAAHYELTREVINLTKMHGAGSLGHEWGHALDHQIAIQYSGHSDIFASEVCKKMPFLKLPDAFCEVVESLKYRNGCPTNYYHNSKRYDDIYSKDSHGYWASDCEMFARAFACYLKDRCKYKSDYLFGHADICSMELEGEVISAMPVGEEREYINSKFDELFKFLIKDEFFTKRPIDAPDKPQSAHSNVKASSFLFTQGTNGQLSFI